MTGVITNIELITEQKVAVTLQPDDRSLNGCTIQMLQAEAERLVVGGVYELSLHRHLPVDGAMPPESTFTGCT